MALHGLQEINEAAEHVRPDGFAFVGADRAGVLVGRDAKMVRPEPHQAFDETDVGADGCVVARGRFVLENLLGQRRP